MRLDRAALDAEALINRGADPRRVTTASVGTPKLRRKRDSLTTLYIRLPARADGEGALSRFALVSDGGAIDQQGEGVLRGLGDLVAASRRVVLLLAAADVTMLQVKPPPLSAARLKAALPSLVEEQVLGDPAECVLIAAPAQSADGLRSVAVVQRSWLEALVRALLALGARTIAALPAQLCLPLQPGNVSGAIGHAELTLRDGLYHGMGLAMASTPAVALQTARALAGDAPLTLYVPADELGQYQALASTPARRSPSRPTMWPHWIAGSKTTTLDLVPGLGSAGARPARLAALALAAAAGLAGGRRQPGLPEFPVAAHEARGRRNPAGEPANLQGRLSERHGDPGPGGADAREHRARQGRQRPGRPGRFQLPAAALGEAARGLARPPALPQWISGNARSA